MSKAINTERVELAPIPPAPLRTRRRRRGQPLLLEAQDGRVVLEILLSRQAAGGARAQIRSASGVWRIDSDPDRRGWLQALAPEGTVALAIGRSGAIRKRRKLELPSGEELEFVRRTLLVTTFRLGDGLITGRASWLAPARARFRVHPRPAALERTDGPLLVGVFTMLAQWGINEEAWLGTIGGPSGP